MTPTGVFKGLIIVDDADRFRIDVLGALVVLSPSPSGGTCIGMGANGVRYSSEALELATDHVENLTCGFGKHRVNIASWLE